MKVASGPLIGNPAAFMRRITPAPASNRNTRLPTTTAVAGPQALGSGYGVPVPSRMTCVCGVASFLVDSADDCATTYIPLSATTTQMVGSRNRSRRVVIDAAVPPDVRKGYDPPKVASFGLGASPLNSSTR